MFNYTDAEWKKVRRLANRGNVLQLDDITAAVYFMQDAICHCVETGQDDTEYCYQLVVARVAEYSNAAVPRSVVEEELLHYRALRLAVHMAVTLEKVKGYWDDYYEELELLRATVARQTLRVV